MSGAIEMVAYGVLVYDPVGRLILKGDDAGWERDKKAHEILKLVEEALKEKGWYIYKQAMHKDRFMLYGPLRHGPWTNRSVMADGTLREVCLAALQYERERSEIP